MKNSALDNFPPCPPAHPPLKSANFIFIVVSLSLKNPEGAERHLNATRQKLPRANFCCSVAASQFLPLNCRAITLTAGGNFERRKIALSCGVQEAIWEAFVN